MPRNSNGRLTNRQARFVEEYQKDLNAKEAAIRAGYAKTRAKQQGWALLRQPKVATALLEAMADRSSRTEVSIDRVIRELALVAFGAPVDFPAWQEAKQPPRFRDKLRALELVGRHLGIWGKAPVVNFEILEGPELAESLREQFERVVEAEAHPLPPEKLPRARPETRKELPRRILIPRRVPKPQDFVRIIPLFRILNTCISPCH